MHGTMVGLVAKMWLTFGKLVCHCSEFHGCRCIESRHARFAAGGDSTLSELLSVPITPQRLPTACAVVVVDLSKPFGVLAVAAEWLKAIHARAQECLDKLKSRQQKAHAAIQQAALGRTTAHMSAGAAASGGHHPDV